MQCTQSRWNYAWESCVLAWTEQVMDGEELKMICDKMTRG